MLTDYELEQLRAAYEKSVNGTAASQYEQEEYVLYGTYEPLSVTLTHIINNKSGISFTSYSHTGLPVAVLAHGVNAGSSTATTTILRSITSGRHARHSLTPAFPLPYSRGGWGLPTPSASAQKGLIHLCVFLRDPAQRRYYVPVVLCLALTALLLLLPTGYEGAVQYQEADRCAARVLAVDDSTIVDTGLVRSGEQRCTLELLGGRFQGRTATGINMLNGSLEQDKLFAPGDKAMVVVSYQGDEILSVTMTDHYRIGKEALLAAVFAVFLILFAGRTGLRAIVSFVLTVLMLWKVLVPLYLKGWNPSWSAWRLLWPSPC